MDLLTQLTASYEDAFQTTPLLICSPGRVNLIGEHTDYNEGFVLPAAIDKAIYLAVGVRTDDAIHLIAHDLNETHTSSLGNLVPTHTWADYILGVVAQFRLAGHQLGGFNCVFGGTIPIGAGLSSSAALENGVGFALNELYQTGLDRLTLLKLSQKAENDFVGAKVGIMDMFASMMGRAGHVIKLDCRSLDYEYAPFSMDNIRIVLCDSQVKHSLVTSEYNTRRAECESGVRFLKIFYPEINSLRDVTMAMLDLHLRDTQPLIYRRCAYVVQENQRLLDGVAALEADDLATFGQLMYGSHEGLSQWYEVSCPELDTLVGIARRQPGVLGARMMGGGFGGCTINLVREDALDAFMAVITKQYKATTGKDTYIHVCKIEDGTHLINPTVH
ncbi:galactokinase [Spirosoma utsteinense]|uniref:Galactokinase n=1 Tax=Spirosoma utsteinense TaxID=2585773 RepID=A0ABR6W372_9BACT|nr:galactokinase [Spirosoma utsteinense]MBC3786691.1 galactokinase [Spirosoma utsteinense]MBC3791054.1 galactokinase [Spirosoma utsteinense]